MALDESVELMRKMQQAGTNLVRLARYASIGVTPSRENMQRAANYFESVSHRLDPILRETEQQQATQRMRGLSMKG
jgi:hypothetical protein